MPMRYREVFYYMTENLQKKIQHRGLERLACACNKISFQLPFALFLQVLSRLLGIAGQKCPRIRQLAYPLYRLQTQVM